MAPMIEDDFVPTLSDADDVSDEEVEVAQTVPQPSNGTKRKREDKKKASAVKKQKKAADDGDAADVSDGAGDRDSDMLSDFEFDNTERAAALGDFDGWAMGGNAEEDEVSKIVERRQGKGKPVAVPDEKSLLSQESDEDLEVDGLSLEDDEGDSEDMGSDVADGSEEPSNAGEESDSGGEDEEVAVSVPHPDDLAADSASDTEDVAEMARQKAFFAPEEDNAAATQAQTNGDSSFASMSLSRPILKGLSEVGFSAPTPIQRKAIPVALEGKDIVGGAVTGSGKTAAFMIPILERLLYRPKRVATIRVAILMPTRELALQCLTVAKKLAAYTDITFGRAIGGLNSREQERELKLRPDIVIATPGRFIDFMRNSASFQVDKIEILVLDEADRMLEAGFSDELNEILGTIPKGRQTMLFSATMTSRVDDLVRVGMQRPVRLMVDAQRTSAAGLVQEFVRLRPGRESKRLGYLMHLCFEVSLTYKLMRTAILSPGGGTWVQPTSVVRHCLTPPRLTGGCLSSRHMLTSLL